LLMATMARLDQEKRVERIRQGLENKRIADPDWKPAGKNKDITKWNKVKETLIKYPTMSADEVARIAHCGIATVYKIKREMA
jgi:DNA invertase Pin-like site-specific DNA recombinase